MSNKINTKCKDCRHCSPPSIIEKYDVFGNRKRKIVYRCEIGMNHTSIKGEVMLIDDDSHYKCSSFSRK